LSIDLERFEHFKDAEFRSLELLNATEIKLTFAVQDKARAYDWITVEFHFTGVSDAKLLDDSKFSLVDMSDGISIFQDSLEVFAIGEYNNTTNAKDSLFYIFAQNIKAHEGEF